MEGTPMTPEIKGFLAWLAMENIKCMERITGTGGHSHYTDHHDNTCKDLEDTAKEFGHKHDTTLECFKKQ